MVHTLKRFFYILLQCTWGLGQTALGFFFFLANIRCPHSVYRGCIDTQWKSPYAGLSLGLFIFTPQADDEYTAQVRVHEFGHAFQSLMLGPLYSVVGIISVTWASLPYFQNVREQKGVPYTACFVEKWASWLGEKVTGEQAVW